MKKRTLISLLSIASGFALFSCAPSTKHLSPAYLEFTVYQERGGMLDYQEWVKKKEAIATTGDSGEKGLSVQFMTVNKKGELIIELTDGTLINAGAI